MSYKLHREYRFTVCGEEFAVTSHDGTHAHIEETRKNGQEDCHMAGSLVRHDGGSWQWEDDWARKQFENYGNDGVADAIPAYLNAHPVPEVF